MAAANAPESIRVEYKAKARIEGRKGTFCVKIPSRQLRSMLRWGWSEVEVEVALSAGISPSYRAARFRGRIRVNCQGKGSLTIPLDIVRKLLIEPGYEVRMVVTPGG